MAIHSSFLEVADIHEYRPTLFIRRLAITRIIGTKVIKMAGRHEAALD